LLKYNLTEQELIVGCEKCKENVRNLLDAAKRLLDSENTFQFALGLYIYAVEEYGKAKLLKRHLERKTPVPGWIFGRDGKVAHQNKLSEGFSCLPSICKQLGAIEIIDTSDSTLTFTIMNKIEVSVPAFASGIFENTTEYPGSTDIGVQLQKACFHVDYNLTAKTWEYAIPADKEQLWYNIKLMEERVGT
jgi:AbiV family abortive infection protein